MGVIGMTGVPVQQGHCAGSDLRPGLFFRHCAKRWRGNGNYLLGCLMALWWMLNWLRPAQRGLNLALSLRLRAPHAAAWSNWPLYVTMFGLCISWWGLICCEI